MYCKIPKDILMTVLLNAAKVVALHPINSVLECFRMTFNKDSIAITASDGETQVTIQTESGAETDAPAVILANAAILTDSLREMPDGEIELRSDTETNTLSLAWGTGSCTMPTFSDSFPLMKDPETEKRTILSVPADILASRMAGAIYAVCADNFRPNLNSLYLETGEKLEFTGSEGNILAHAEAAAEKGTPLQKMLIPLPAAKAICRLLPDTDTPVTLVSDGRRITLTFDQTEINTRLVDSKYPDYKTLLPKDVQTSVTINRKDALSAISRASAYDPDGVVTITVDPAQILIESTNAMTKANIKESLPAKVTGVGLRASYSAAHLKNVISHIHGDNITVSFSGERNIAMFRNVEGCGLQETAIVTPRMIIEQPQKAKK